MINKNLIKTPSICKALINGTICNEIQWVSLDLLTKILIAKEIAIEEIGWLYSYFQRLQTVRHMPLLEKTYITIYENRVFVIAPSKYTGFMRLDFISSFDGEGNWFDIITPQAPLLQLHSIIQFSNTKSRDSNYITCCKKIFEATNCIRA